MSNTSVIIAQKGNSKAGLALSSLIHSLYETDVYAVARFVKKKNAEPVMVVLAPEIDVDFECLVDVQVGGTNSPCSATLTMYPGSFY